MSTPCNASEKPLTVAQLDEWVYSAGIKRVQLHLEAMEPLYSTQRELAFLEMSHLLQEAIEEVRVVSDSLRDESKALRVKAAKLREHSTQLIERSTPHQEP